MIIDAHQHFWNLEKVAYPWLDPSYGSICRSIEADELEPLIRKAGINKTVIVQAMNSYEDTEYMLKVAAEREWVGAVVGWVPLNIPEVADKKLQAYAANPYFKGARHLIHEEKDPDWVIRDSVMEGLQILSSFGLTFDIVGVFPNHLKHIPYLAEQIPDLRMVIDHFAKPPIKEKQMGAWADQFAAAAQYPNVYAKVSGLNTAADWHTWNSEDLRPYIDYALTHFGADRLMFGSDWPVANLAGDFEKVWEQTNQAISDYSEDERAAILGGTAAKFYGIQAES
ncbi:amidohydrolase family protein [Paenibacillus anseongense]|uniref:amidohydrolase family protein n=1 Tax=Paenibacillus anseongense TaxID=2682845 RepID=UPI002DBBA479|nr:amidohydrolase family protein [Paenibacillus anseongense]MEC0266770.1 amidohydrolase family protein [Paenibacillus anseongense]